MIFGVSQSKQTRKNLSFAWNKISMVKHNELLKEVTPFSQLYSPVVSLRVIGIEDGKERH